MNTCVLHENVSETFIGWLDKNTCLGRTVNGISCVFIGYKNVFEPIAVLVTNRFRLEQKSYLPLNSGFDKTTIFSGPLDNRPNVLLLGQ